MLALWFEAAASLTNFIVASFSGRARHHSLLFCMCVGRNIPVQVVLYFQSHVLRPRQVPR